MVNIVSSVCSSFLKPLKLSSLNNFAATKYLGDDYLSTISRPKLAYLWHYYTVFDHFILTTVTFIIL